jgi:hypothetical protein
VTTVVVDTLCSQVWPGDCNSDGIVGSLDVFEIGFAFNNTGTSRSPGGNTYVSQYANNWSGTVSSGKNKCHADCNGDGTVNLNDTIAIYNNFSMTHSFRPGRPATNPDISISPSQGVFIPADWNKVDLLRGDASNQMSQLYGVAFDLNFDQSLIETGSAYLVYTSSFLNANNQNVKFRKVNFTNGKLYAATVRVDGANVSGNGKFAEFHFKMKAGLPQNTVLNLSVSNANKVSNTRQLAAITGATSALQLDANPVGIKSHSNTPELFVYPNPAENEITLQTSGKESVSFILFDVCGRKIMAGTFAEKTTLDLADFESGAYFLKMQTSGKVSFKKLILEK